MEFRFAHPAALLILLLPVLVMITARRRNREIIAPVMRYSDVRLVSGLFSTWRVRLRRIPDLLRLVAWVLLVIALARPQIGDAQEIIRGRGVDIVLALDISSSMATPDFSPENRLEAAKTVIADFIQGRRFDRIGLVVFARDAYHIVPPTLDYDVLLQALTDIQLITELGREDGTAIGLGIASAANMLREGDAISRVIVLLTDGANNAGPVAPVTIAEAVTALKIRVYTVGMGRPGSTELNEATLEEIAQITNGQYFRAVDLTGLQQIYERIDMLERSDVSQQIFVRWQDQAAGWLIGGLALLLIERLLRHTLFQAVP